MRRWLSALVVSLCLARVAGATALTMDPGTFHIEASNGSVLLWQLDWTFVSAETDGSTTQLVLLFDYEQYQGEGGGSLLFDVPVLSPRDGYLGGGVFATETGYPNRFTWFFLGNCCVSTPGVISDASRKNIFLVLSGVPTTVEFGYGQIATFTPVPEPTPGLAVASGLAVLSAIRRRRALASRA